MMASGGEVRFRVESGEVAPTSASPELLFVERLL